MIGEILRLYNLKLEQAKLVTEYWVHVSTRLVSGGTDGEVRVCWSCIYLLRGLLLEVSEAENVVKNGAIYKEGINFEAGK